MATVVIIPARFASTRLPGKPLIDIAGRPMIHHVVSRVGGATSVDRTLVATDDDRIAAVVREFGGEVVMTSSDITSGTDRVAAAAREIGSDPDDIIVNVQGDEPLVDPGMIDLLVAALKETDTSCATPVCRITSTRDLFDTNVVKVALRSDYTPLYFSRSPIPCVRDCPPEEWLGTYPFFRHVGIYAYRRSALDRFVASSPTPLELSEQLEQLRMLDLGIPMFCVETEYDGHAVDTPEDVMKVEQMMG